MRKPNLIPALATGMLAGVAATGPMTSVMLALNRKLQPTDRAIPPGEVTAHALEKIHLRRQLSDEGLKDAAVFAHFAYGGAAGAILAPFQRLIPLPGWLVGALYGLLVWAASYVGYLPALDLTRPARDEPAARHGMMIVAHLVWGSVLGAIIATVRPRR